MASKPKSASNNSSSNGNAKKVIDDARLAAFAKSRNEQARGYNQMGKVVLATAGVSFLAKLSGKVAAGTAATTGAAEEARILAKANPSTSKTMNILEGSKVITSNNSGVANATSGIDKVTLQKSLARVQAGIKSGAAGQGAKAGNQVLTTNQILAKGAVAGATATQAIRGVGSKPKPKPKPKGK